MTDLISKVLALTDADYERLYRKLHPRSHPYSSHERQRELSDLWPADQSEWKRQTASLLREGM